MKKTRKSELVTNDEVRMSANIAKTFIAVAALIAGSFLVVSFLRPERFAKLNSVLKEFFNNEIVLGTYIGVVILSGIFVFYLINQKKIKAFSRKNE